MNPLTRKASHDELRSLAMDYAVVVATAAALVLMLIGGV
jgi:hypothetical protein